MESDLERYRKTFFAEAAEHLAALESSLLRLESGGCDPAAADAAFRAAHSLKGGADAVGFPQLTRFTHALEEVLDRCRSAGTIPAQRLDTLLDATDFLTKLVDGTRTGAAEPTNFEEWLRRLGRELPAESGHRGPLTVQFTQSARISGRSTVLTRRRNLRFQPPRPFFAPR